MSEDRDDRELGPEMTAERWIVVGGDSIMWQHPPSHRCVTVTGPYPRKSEWCDATAVVALPEEPADPLTEGWIVGCAEHDDLGNPTRGSCFWIASYASAIRRARAIRVSILDRVPVTISEQQNLFDDTNEGADRHGSE